MPQARPSPPDLDAAMYAIGALAEVLAPMPTAEDMDDEPKPKKKKKKGTLSLPLFYFYEN